MRASEILDLGHGERRVLGADSRRALADVNQAILVAIDQRPQQHAADDAEDRRVGADAERERRRRSRRALARAGSASAMRMSCHRAARCVEPVRQPDARIESRVSVTLPNSFSAARRAASDPRRVRSVPSRSEPCGRGSRRRGRSESGLTRLLSCAGTAGFMTRPIASTSCDHRSCSRDSCAFPAAVSW